MSLAHAFATAGLAARRTDRRTATTNAASSAMSQAVRPNHPSSRPMTRASFTSPMPIDAGEISAR
ncbi:hypothetical protein, partial [Agromyces humi]|uniref:hypothetical protein n=1 Tax=Agromyces humi TaxID=1766800 RepID=UPI001F1C6916